MIWLHRIVLFIHVLFVFLYMLCHGASAAVAFRVRRETRPERIQALLDLSWSTLGSSYQVLLIAVLAGIALGFMGHWWRSRWLWASIVILVIVLAVMVRVAVRHYRRIRKAVGQHFDGAEWVAGEPDSPAEIAAALSAGRPVALAAFGIAGWGVILWMMLFKPA